MAWLGALPQSANAIGQMATTSQPFVWGGGGRRMTPEDIAFQRRLAAQEMQGDYSPVQHWAQGLGRVLDGLSGGLRTRRLDRAAQANASEADDVTKILLEGSQGGSEGAPITSGRTFDDEIAAALANPYLPDSVKNIAMKQWERANPKPQQPTEFQQNYQWLNGMNPTFAQQYLQGRIDPEIVVPTPTGPYVGPRSQLSATIGEGGGQQSGPVGGSPPPAPQGNFADLRAAGQMIQSMGARGFLGWQQQHGTPVLVRTPEEMAKLPTGTKVVSPDGRTGVKK